MKHEIECSFYIITRVILVDIMPLFYFLSEFHL